MGTNATWAQMRQVMGSNKLVTVLLFCICLPSSIGDGDSREDATCSGGGCAGAHASSRQAREILTSTTSPASDVHIRWDEEARRRRRDEQVRLEVERRQSANAGAGFRSAKAADEAVRSREPVSERESGNPERETDLEIVWHVREETDSRLHYLILLSFYREF